MKEGVYSIWKSKGPSSHDVVAKIRKVSKIKKVGHAGTLDPLAEGVLVVAVGREFTKKIDQIKQQEKEYIARIKFGFESSTDDEEGEKNEVSFETKPTENEIKKTLNYFVGNIKQRAPRYSAVKIYGKEAYKRARNSEEFPLPLRDVEIKEIELIEYDWPFLKIRVVSGLGVYIRSLAKDLGLKLNCGGYLSGLIRTRVGDYSKMNSKTIEELFGSKNIK